jgi:tRNA threonylcarbamoyladenosine biosynthesis protein TsaB
MAINFVSIHGAYHQLEISLFLDRLCIDSAISTDARASSSLIPMLDAILKENSLTISDLSFIAIDKGPGAFTSLRVTISTINGIAFDKKIPVIGISGLEALNKQVHDKHPRFNFFVALLNAYNNDAYFLVTHNNSKNMGCQNIDILLNDLKKISENKPILFYGQGSQLYKPKIQALFLDNAVFDNELQLPSAQTVGIMAYECWTKKENIENQIKPLYLKTQHFAIRK